jgi:pyruvate formate lyase activating enzyme
MIFGGIQKTSLIDFPGKVSCVLFCSGCNFDCPYCHNPPLKGKPWFSPALDEKVVLEFLGRRKECLDGVVISGGEPTIQDCLPRLCRTLKEMGFLVKLDTNGSRPRIVKDLLDQEMVDFVAMDLKTDPSEYEAVFRGECDSADILASVRVVMNSAPAYEFRTTCVKPLISPSIIEKISKTIKGAKRFTLQRFVNSNVSESEPFGRGGGEFAEDELIKLKSIADKWVMKCTIR